MDTILTFVCEHAAFAHLILFGLLLLAGLNIPISEDLILLGGGMIVASCLDEGFYRMGIWLFFGCIFSAWEAYWIGRIWGPKLYGLPWIGRHFTPQRVGKLNAYYERFGIFTFIIGRFIPGGVRNALFMTAGLGGMPFPLFILRDAVACLIQMSTLFYLGYTFAENWDLLTSYIHTYNRLLLTCLFTAVLLCVGVYSIRHLSSSQ